jgi:hypothetical protein
VNTRTQANLKRWLLLAAEVALVLAIVGLLLLFWLPGLVGPHPGIAPVEW